MAVRFSDDSPEDGTAGALVHRLVLSVNGEARPDVVPYVFRHDSRQQTQVGRVSTATQQSIGHHLR